MAYKTPAIKQIASQKPFKVEKEIFKPMTEEWTKEVGDKIVDNIKSFKNPKIKYVVLDDYHNESGTIFVYLDMEQMKDANGRTKYYFKDMDSNLKSISRQIRIALGKNKENANFEEIVNPKKTYDSYGNFDGYNNDAYKIDYYSVGWHPKQKFSSDFELKKEATEQMPDVALAMAREHPSQKKLREFAK